MKKTQRRIDHADWWIMLILCWVVIGLGLLLSAVF